MSLHGRAQADLLRYIETELKPSHQVIYTTHSPFMVDPDHFDRVRIVQDKSIDTKGEIPAGQDGTKVLVNVFDASEDTLFPLRGALGYEIHQTLFIGPNNLFVEGPADLIFLRVMSGVLEREGQQGLSDQWTITPVGGSGKVPTFVALLAPQKGMKIATLLDIQASDRLVIEDIYKKKLLEKKRVLTYADFTKGTEADVEDMFDRQFYLDIVNAEYAKELQHSLTLAELNLHHPRILRAIEERLKNVPLKMGQFGHYRPARYLADNISALESRISAETKQRFVEAFARLEKLLR